MTEEQLQQSVNQFDREVEELIAWSKIEESKRLLSDIVDKHPQTPAAEAAQVRAQGDRRKSLPSRISNRQTVREGEIEFRPAFSLWYGIEALRYTKLSCRSLGEAAALSVRSSHAAGAMPMALDGHVFIPAASGAGTIGRATFFLSSEDMPTQSRGAWHPDRLPRHSSKSPAPHPATPAPSPIICQPRQSARR